ncbi:SCO family protein [Kaarinaea lacus]
MMFVSDKTFSMVRVGITGLLLAFSQSVVVYAHGNEQHAAPSSATIVKVKAPASEIERARNYFTDLPLVTNEGKDVKFYSDMLDDKVVLLNVMYTKCEDACPLLTKHLAAAKDQLGDLFGKEVFFVSISNDPNRDTPEKLTAFAKKQNAYHPGWKFVTGNKNEVDAIIRKLGLYTPNIEEHNTLLLAGNTRTRHWIKIVPNIPPEAIAQKLRDLAEEG